MILSIIGTSNTIESILIFRQGVILVELFSSQTELAESPFPLCLTISKANDFPCYYIPFNLFCLFIYLVVRDKRHAKL